MSIAAQILVSYFLLGLVSLLLFDLATKRIRSNMSRAGIRAQIEMAASGNPIGPKVGMALMVVLTWLLWPMVLIGAVAGGGREEGQEGQEDEIQRREPTAGYLAKKIWYGECPNCRVILKPDGLLGGSTCPVCKSHFETIIRRSNRNGMQEQGTDSADREGGGRADSNATCKKAGGQPDRKTDTTPG